MLKQDLIRVITNIGNGFVPVKAPCGGLSVGINGCRAVSVTDNLKLLIVIGDGSNDHFANPDVLAWQHDILPVWRTGTHVFLPPQFSIPNAAFWQSNINEVIPRILGLMGVSEEEQRIFISYRRTDTSAFAEQLFDRLNHEGFDVFLDRFSIEPGVNFQTRLYQELADKAMVLLLESANYQDSKWVQLEIDFAKKYRLGLLAINVDPTKKVPSVDDEYRRAVSLDSTSKTLPQHELDTLILDIKEQHAIAMYRKRRNLTNNILAALTHQGANPMEDSQGFISVSDRLGNRHFSILATPRPPKISDYHYTDIAASTGDKFIIGPEFMEEKRENLNTWLAQKSTITFFNEGQILDLSTLIYP